MTLLQRHENYSVRTLVPPSGPMLHNILKKEKHKAITHMH